MFPRGVGSSPRAAENGPGRGVCRIDQQLSTVSCPVSVAAGPGSSLLTTVPKGTGYMAPTERDGDALKINRVLDSVTFIGKPHL